jgi:hypothetical protein
MTFSSLKPSTKPMKRVGFRKPTTALTGALSAESRQMAAKVKPVKCKACRQEFIKARPGQKVCGPDCAEALAMSERAKAERKAQKAQKEVTKPLKKRLKETEKAVNLYVRVRDWLEGCCSCDKPAHWDGQWHASHFKSVGSNSLLRFHLWNIYKGCSECNRHRAGNIAEYTKRLELRFGPERVQWLEDRKNGTRKYTAEYLDRLKRVISKRTKRLIKRQGVGE